MEGKREQKSQFVQIPIEEYEKDMETKSSKEKKKEILDLFANSNNLHSEYEFDQIKQELHYACKDGDLDLIKVYLSETIQNDSKTLTFKIDQINQTASLFKVNAYIENLVVPRTVKHESKDYLITSISGICNIYIDSIDFAKDSAVKVIYGYAFLNSGNIKKICFPASLKELKKRWCQFIFGLKRIEISPLNDQFVVKENQYLLGKSDENDGKFDTLLFASRDIKKMLVPPNIKIISSYAFRSCKKLNKLLIPRISNLQTIEKYAFQYSTIKEIYFPASLKELKEGWCCDIEQLTKIEISPLNKHYILKDNKCLLGKSDENNDEFDILLFACRDIKEISIPSNIKIISSYAFSYCKNLTKVEFPPNSNLQTIGLNAFSDSKIKEISIPSNVSKICRNAFYDCSKLNKFLIPQNSKLQTIEQYAFRYSAIKEIYLPATLKELKEGWCCDIKQLTKIEISPLNNQFVMKENKYLLGKSDENNDEFDILLFACRDIKKIFIPSNIKIISSYAFSNCKNLTKVEIPPNSNLQKIGSHAFSFSKIKEIFIPSNIKTISFMVFYYCSNLLKVEFSPNSILEKIEYGAFSFSDVKCISIQSKITEIDKYAFLNCMNVQIIEISDGSQLKSNSFTFYYMRKDIIIMCCSKINITGYFQNDII